MAKDAAKIGRPKKAPGEQRTERLPGITLTAAERHMVELMAERAGLSVMEFCRRAVLGQRVPQRRTKASDRALIELNRVGVNLNQIAARVNMTGDLAEDYRVVLAELLAAIRQVQEGME